MKKRCPKCNSERILINGVLQNQKKGLFYYLSGQGVYNASFHAGQKLAGNKTPNARCQSCGHEWVV